MRRRQLQLGAGSRTVLEAGDGGRPVLFVHGFPDNAETWSPVLERLSARGLRCAAPFLPGYGETPAPRRGNYRASALARQLLATMDALGLQRTALVGHDWGAVAAYACAALAPERIDQLVIIGLPPIPVLARNLVRSPRHLLGLRHLFFFQLPFLAGWWLRRRDLSGIEALWRRWSPGWTIPADHLASVKETFRTPGTLSAALSYYRQAQLTAALRLRDAVESLRLLSRRIAVPTLLIAGSRDGGINPSLFAGYARHFDAPATLEVVPEAGHFAQQEKPGAIAGLIAGFLGTSP